MVRITASLGMAAFALFLLGQPGGCEAWEMTRGLVAATIDYIDAEGIDTESWDIKCDLGYQKSLEDGRRVSFDLDWDYGELRDGITGTRSVSPDVIDVDLKWLKEVKAPYSTFWAVTFLSDHDWEPAIVGVGFGYQTEAATGLIAELGLQGTKDISTGENPQIGYRFNLNYRRPLLGGLELWLDARSQGSFEDSATKQEFLELRALYEITRRLKLTAIQRLENPLQQERSRNTTRFLIAYELQ